jgi:hypothetical protein
MYIITTIITILTNSFAIANFAAVLISFHHLSRYRRLALAVLSFAYLPTSTQAVGIMVSEYKNTADNGTITNKMAADEYIEFVITENASASSLASLTFGSANPTTSALQGVFGFDLITLNNVLSLSGQTQFLKGTIIVVKGGNLGAENLTYNPTVANASNHDAWSIELTAGFGARDHSETTVDGTLSVDGAGGVIWISSTVPANATDTSGFIDAIGHDNAPGAIANAVSTAFGSGHILLANVGAPKVVYNTADSVTALASDINGSMGAPNGGSNTTWVVNTLRGAVPEPSRALLCFAGLLAALFTRRRRV